MISRVRRARPWLEAHPRHRDALFVAERLYLAGRSQPDVELWDWTRKFLATNLPHSQFAEFAATDFVNATTDGVNRSLAGYIERQLFSLHPNSAVREESPVAGDHNRFAAERIQPVLAVVAAALARNNEANTALSEELVFQLHLALAIAPQRSLPGIIRQRVDRLSDESREIADLLIATDRPITERLMDLERRRRPANTRTISLYQEYLWRELSEKDRDSADVLTVDVERLMEEHNYEEALQRLSHLETIRPSTRTRYLTGWCHQSLGEYDEAASRYRSIADPGAADPWRRTAAEALELVANQPRLRAEFAAGLERFLSRLRDDANASFQITLDSKPDLQPSVRLFVHVDQPRGRFRAASWQGQQLTLAGAGDAKEYWLLFGDETVRIRKAIGGMFVRFQFHVDAPRDKGGRWTFNFNTCPDPLQFGQDLRTSLRQPAVASAEALAQTVNCFVGPGFLRHGPATVRETTWECQVPDSRSATWRRDHWVLARDGHTLRWVRDDFSLEVRLAEQPESLEWAAIQDLPEQTGVSSDNGRETRAFGAAFQLFTDLMSRSHTSVTEFVDGEPLAK